MGGLKIETGSFKGRVHPDFNTPRFLEAVAECRSLLADPSSRVLLNGRNRVAAVFIPVSAGRGVEAVIKEFRASGFKKIKTLVSRSKAAKAWRGASACAARRVSTPAPLVYLERRQRGFVAESYFVAEYEKNTEEIRHLFNQNRSSKDRSSLLAALAVFLVFCHEQGILHRDLSDGNILVRSKGDDDFAFWLVDTNRIRVRGHIGLLARVRNLIRLGIPPSDQDLFLRFYLRGKGGQGFLRLWYRWNKKAYWGFVVLKKKLRLRKIAESLRIQ